MTAENTIALVPYDKNWPQLYNQEQKALAKAFDTFPITFSHIGSTSIKGLIAKPIIDIMAEVSNIEEVDAYNAALKKLGYEAHGTFGIPMRRFFKKTPNDSNSIAVNLHIYQQGDYQIARHLLFRDYLREHSDEVKRYSVLKKKLATAHSNDIHEYLSGKNSFIKEIDYKALLKAEKKPFSLPKPAKINWTKEKIIEAMEANKHLQMTFFPRYSLRMNVSYYHGAVMVSSSIIDDTFNYILDAKLNDGSAPEIAAHIIDSYREEGLPVSWWVFPSSEPKELSNILENQGMKLIQEEIGMSLDIENYSPKISEELNLRRVINPLDIFTLHSVQATAWKNRELYQQIFRELPPATYRTGSPVELYLGYAKGKVVVTGMVVFFGNVAGIYALVTLPGESRKGYGTAMANALIYRAKHLGYKMCTLQATEENHFLFKKIGFEECCTFKVFD